VGRPKVELDGDCGYRAWGVPGCETVRDLRGREAIDFEEERRLRTICRGKVEERRGGAELGSSTSADLGDMVHDEIVGNVGR